MISVTKEDAKLGYCDQFEFDTVADAQSWFASQGITRDISAPLYFSDFAPRNLGGGATVPVKYNFYITEV